jgi:hypothetical protein
VNSLHPEVYIIIIPAFGVISQVISHFANKPIFGQMALKPSFLKLGFSGDALHPRVKRPAFGGLIHVGGFPPRSLTGSTGVFATNYLQELQNEWVFTPADSARLRRAVNLIFQNTKYVSNLFDSFLVIIFDLLSGFIGPAYLANPQITNAQINNLSRLFLSSSMLVGISETIRLLLTRSFHNNTIVAVNSPIPQLNSAENGNYSKPNAPKGPHSLNEWLAGLIDGDGCFLLSKKGYASLEIVMELRDQHCLYKIKQIFGGSIKVRTGKNHLRYRLHDKKGLLFLINSVNGEIRNPIRILQLGRICEKYKIELLQPKPLTYLNGWFSGFLDSDGSIYLNLQSDQLFITATQKNKYLLDPLKELYGGQIYVISKVAAFKWTLFRKEEIIYFVNNYIKLYPLKSAKHFRFLLLPKYFELRSLKAHLAPENTILGKAWKEFLNNWEHYSS